MFNSLRPEEAPKSESELLVTPSQSRLGLSSLCISFRSAFQQLSAMSIPTTAGAKDSEQNISQSSTENKSLFSKALSTTTELCKALYNKTVELVVDVVTAVVALDAEGQNDKKQASASSVNTAARIFESIPQNLSNQPSQYFSETQEEKKKDKDDTSTNAPARDGSRFLLSLVGKAYQLGVITFVSPYYLLESVKNGKLHPMLLEKLNLDALTRSAEAETLSAKVNDTQK